MSNEGVIPLSTVQYQSSQTYLHCFKEIIHSPFVQQHYNNKSFKGYQYLYIMDNVKKEKKCKC